MTEPAEAKFSYLPGTVDQKIPRGPNAKLPCFSCPKCKWSAEKSPRVGREVELSGKNWRTLELYYRAQANGGRLDGADAVTQKNFGIIHRVLSNHNRSQLNLIAAGMARARMT